MPYFPHPHPSQIQWYARGVSLIYSVISETSRKRQSYNRKTYDPQMCNGGKLLGKTKYCVKCIFSFYTRTSLKRLSRMRKVCYLVSFVRSVYYLLCRLNQFINCRLKDIIAILPMFWSSEKTVNLGFKTLGHIVKFSITSVYFVWSSKSVATRITKPAKCAIDMFWLSFWQHLFKLYYLI